MESAGEDAVKIVDMTTEGSECSEYDVNLVDGAAGGLERRDSERSSALGRILADTTVGGACL